VNEHSGQSVKRLEELLTMRPQPQQAIEDLGRIHPLYKRMPSEARKLAHRSGTLGQPGAKPPPAKPPGHRQRAPGEIRAVEPSERSRRPSVVVEPPANRVRAEVLEPQVMLAAVLGATEAPRRLETRR
jgi:hypothetical protein